MLSTQKAILAVAATILVLTIIFVPVPSRGYFPISSILVDRFGIDMERLLTEWGLLGVITGLAYYLAAKFGRRRE